MSGDKIHLEIPRGPTPVSVFTTPMTEPLLYPGTRPSWSFCFLGARILPIEAERGRFEVRTEDGAAEDLGDFVVRMSGWRLADLRAVLAVGSNACPARLADADKYGGVPGVAIPVLRGWIRDVVSVYSARLGVYGSVPATVAGAPGARSRLWVTLPSEEQIRQMDASERRGERYELIDLDDAEITLPGGVRVGPVSAYFESEGLGHPETGGPILLDCFETENASLPRLGQAEARRIAAASMKDPGRARENDSGLVKPQKVDLSLPARSRRLSVGSLPSGPAVFRFPQA